ncbi:MAG TPA: hypothetical protein VHA14_16780 [Bryobacteraceae bacterium]|nr:hypothetical protein [Bryobacteraceae bacterium]
MALRSRRFLTFFAKQLMAEEVRAARRGGDPRAVFPRRFVADVLGVAAFEIGNPVSIFVLVEGDDAAFHQLAVGFSM